jgi:hypothetical protein
VVATPPASLSPTMTMSPGPTIARKASRQRLRPGQPYAHLTRTAPDRFGSQRHWAERIPRQARSTLLHRRPDLTVTADQITDHPAAALLSAAEDAELLVLGSHGMSGSPDSWSAPSPSRS